MESVARPARTGSLIGALLLLMLAVGPNGIFSSLVAWAAPTPIDSHVGATAGRNQGPSNQVHRKDPIPPALPQHNSSAGHASPPSPMVLQRPPQSMKAASVLLHANTALDFVGSDGRFEVSAPAGAVTSDDIVAAGGQIHLHIEQLLGPSGGTNGGRIILGAYQISVLGLDGPLPLFAFHQPLTFTYHYAASDLSNIQPDHAFVILDDGSSLTPSS